MKETVQRFEEVADRNVMFRGRDGQPPWEFVDDERHGVHARLCRWFLECLGGNGCTRVGEEHVGGKRDVVDDRWDVGMESE